MVKISADLSTFVIMSLTWKVSCIYSCCRRLNPVGVLKRGSAPRPFAMGKQAGLLFKIMCDSAGGS